MGTGESHAPTTPGAGRVGRLTVFRLLFKLFPFDLSQRDDPSTHYVVQLIMWENPSTYYWSLLTLPEVFEIATCGKTLQRTIICGKTHQRVICGKTLQRIICGKTLQRIICGKTLQRTIVLGHYWRYRKYSKLLHVGKPFNAILNLQTSPPHTSWLINTNLGKNWIYEVSSSSGSKSAVFTLGWKRSF